VDNGVLRGLAGWFHMPLDVERMRSALATLKGEHDFSAFRSSECQAKTPVKTLYAANIDQRGACIVFTFRANAFLHHMVRNLVGSAVYVGAGRHDLEDFRRIFESRDRTLAAPTFAPDGLYLADIEYDPLFDLPAFPERVTLF
jgi:tRNA pseudouridine38-40 synthase